jgi:hypothetical protein
MEPVALTEAVIGSGVPSLHHRGSGPHRALHHRRGIKGLSEGATLRFGAVNGLPGMIAYSPDGYVQIVAFEIEDNRIRTIHSVRNPDKLKHLTPA